MITTFTTSKYEEGGAENMVVMWSGSKKQGSYMNRRQLIYYSVA
jgi:hypothetical protein